MGARYHPLLRQRQRQLLLSMVLLHMDPYHEVRTLVECRNLRWTACGAKACMAKAACLAVALMVALMAMFGAKERWALFISSGLQSADESGMFIRIATYTRKK